MIINSYTPIDFAFGQTPQNTLSQLDSETRGILRTVNILNVADCIPIVGIVSGLARCIITAFLACSSKNEPYRRNYNDIYAMQGIRGAISMIGLGFLFIIPEILFTIGKRQKERIQ